MIPLLLYGPPLLGRRARSTSRRSPASRWSRCSWRRSRASLAHRRRRAVNARARAGSAASPWRAGSFVGALVSESARRPPAAARVRAHDDGGARAPVRAAARPIGQPVLRRARRVQPRRGRWWSAPGSASRRASSGAGGAFLLVPLLLVVVRRPDPGHHRQLAGHHRAGGHRRRRRQAGHGPGAVRPRRSRWSWARCPARSSAPPSAAGCPATALKRVLFVVILGSAAPRLVGPARAGEGVTACATAS